MKTKSLALFLLLMIFNFFSCSADGSRDEPTNPQPGEIEGYMQYASEGSYPQGEIVYVDANLKPTTKEKARLYMKRELLGRQLVWNDGSSYDYWKDKQYFQDTPIINYIYHYYDIRDNKRYFTTQASELEGKNYYIFHGLAFWSHKNDIVKLNGGYQFGKLNGDFAAISENGEVTERFWYTNGTRGPITLKKEDFYTPAVAKWEAELEIDHYMRKTHVYHLKADGTLEFYQNGYMRQSLDGPWQLWTSNDNPPQGLWKYTKKTDNTGEVEFYYKGVLIMKADAKIINANELSLRSTYIDKQYDQKNVGKELIFKKS